MGSIKDILDFLKTLWGSLAAAAIAFPGAAMLLKLPIAVENSRVAALYPTLSTVGSAFATLILIAYSKELESISTARRVAIVSIFLGMSMLFAFVTVRTIYLDIEARQVVATAPASTSQGANEVVITQKRGVMIYDQSQDGRLINHYEKGDPYDIVSLALFTLTFMSITVAFTSLGIHAFQRSKA